MKAYKRPGLDEVRGIGLCSEAYDSDLQCRRQWVGTRSWDFDYNRFAAGDFDQDESDEDSSEEAESQEKEFDQENTEVDQSNDEDSNASEDQASEIEPVQRG